MDPPTGLVAHGRPGAEDWDSAPAGVLVGRRGSGIRRHALERSPVDRRSGAHRIRAAWQIVARMLGRFLTSRMSGYADPVLNDVTVPLVGRAHVDFLRVRSSLCRAH